MTIGGRVKNLSIVEIWPVKVWVALRHTCNVVNRETQGNWETRRQRHEEKETEALGDKEKGKKRTGRQQVRETGRHGDREKSKEKTQRQRKTNKGRQLVRETVR